MANDLSQPSDNSATRKAPPMIELTVEEWHAGVKEWDARRQADYNSDRPIAMTGSGICAELLRLREMLREDAPIKFAILALERHSLPCAARDLAAWLKKAQEL